MNTYLTRQGDMLDAICWHYYGREGGAVEAVLRANRHLADVGAVLPAGLVIHMPDIEPPQTTQPIKLWD